MDTTVQITQNYKELHKRHQHNKEDSFQVEKSTTEKEHQPKKYG